MFRYNKAKAGFSLIEAIIVIGITVLIFSALFVGFEFALKFIAHSRAKMTALSLATDRSEYIRSLPYDSVGTVAGIPSGSIPQNRTVTLNGITFNERVLIEYVDDAADGLAGLDTNGVVADYKRFKVEYTWSMYEESRSINLISTIVPRSIETTAGGGTVRVYVTDAESQPMPGASVRLLNTTGTSTIDVTRLTDATGQALFTGAPAGSGYEVFVTRAGYSSDQTREADAALPFPVSQPFSLLESDVSPVYFQIDRLADLRIEVFTSETIANVTESFDDSLGMYASSSVLASTSQLTLSESGGVYASAGEVWLNPITPSPMEAWGLVTVDANVPANTSYRIRFYASTTPASLIDEDELPGNTVGFSGRYINLGILNPVSYPTVVIKIDLETSNTAITPSIEEIDVAYASNRTMLGGHTFSLRGNKIIGADASAQNVYKYSQSTTTNASGYVFFDDIEWDEYEVTLGGSYDVAEACSVLPYRLQPGADDVLTLRAQNGGADNLRLMVKTADGSPVIGAEVDLDDNAGTVVTLTTGACGQVFFPSLNSSIEYSATITADDLSTYTIGSIFVSGVSYEEAIMVP